MKTKIFILHPSSFILCMDILTFAQSLRHNGTPFVLATVVRAEKPTSAKAGAKAIVIQNADGSSTLTGWVGGSCAQPTVVRESLKALIDLQPRLLHLGPPESLSGIARNGLVEVPLTCASEGTLEIYIEPYAPQPQLVLIGHLPVVEVLCALGKDIGYDVLVMGQGATPERFGRADVALDLNLSALTLNRLSYVVVASHGNYDEPALEAALRSDAPYVALVASQKRLAKVIDYLRDCGLNDAQLSRLKCPAGLDVGAVTPEEIALSILAEIVQVRRRGKLGAVGNVEEKRKNEKLSEEVKSPSSLTAIETAIETAIDPVCDMEVTIATALWKTDHNGQTYYFCAPGCKRSFTKSPEKYLAGYREKM
ncbi:MAG: XdhC family protein [Chloroflexota bacterium]